MQPIHWRITFFSLIIFTAFLSSCRFAPIRTFPPDDHFEKQVSDTLTVVNIRSDINKGYHEVMFQKSARIYKLDKTKIEYFERIQESQKNKTPIIIYRSDKKSEEILSVKKLN